MRHQPCQHVANKPVPFFKPALGSTTALYADSTAASPAVALLTRSPSTGGPAALSAVDGSRQQLVARLRKAYHPHGLRGDVLTITPQRRTAPSAEGNRPPAASRTEHQPQHGRKSGSQRSSPSSVATHSDSETAHSHLGDIGSQHIQRRHACPSQHSRRRCESPSPSRLVAPSQQRGCAVLSHHSRHKCPSQRRGAYEAHSSLPVEDPCLFP